MVCSHWPNVVSDRRGVTAVCGGQTGGGNPVTGMAVRQARKWEWVGPILTCDRCVGIMRTSGVKGPLDGGVGSSSRARCNASRC